MVAIIVALAEVCLRFGALVAVGLLVIADIIDGR